MHSMVSGVRSTGSIVRVPRVASGRGGEHAASGSRGGGPAVHKVGAVTDPRAAEPRAREAAERRAADAAARVRERAPDLANRPVEQLVHDYLDAAEPHDLATVTADDVAGAV